MRIVLSSLVFAALIASACAREQKYPLKGQVLAIDAARQELTVKHDDITGFMPGMTMLFKVREAGDVSGRKAGDLISATLVVADSTGYLENIVKIGEAPLSDPPPAGLRMIEPGTAVPDAEFVDQNGRAVRVSSWRGRATAVTFVYTRCPLPDFCPLMDRKFLFVQRALQTDGQLASRVHLVSVSFDPDYDTPEVLRAHAVRVGADARHWSFVTGSRAAVDPFAAAFGVAIMRGDTPLAEIVHNLRTAVIDADGRLVTVLNGSDWKPEQLVDAIRTADGQR